LTKFYHNHTASLVTYSLEKSITDLTIFRKQTFLKNRVPMHFSKVIVIRNSDFFFLIFKMFFPKKRRFGFKINLQLTAYREYNLIYKNSIFGFYDGAKYF